MPSFNIKAFTNPETLSRISPAHLMKLLAKSKMYFMKRGLVWPASGADFDLEKLAHIFMTPEESQLDFPSNLANTLWMLAEMDSTRGMDLLFKSATNHQYEFKNRRALTPIEVAIEAWDFKPEWLEEAHAEIRLVTSRTYEYYTLSGDEVFDFKKPSEKAIKQIESDLKHWFRNHKRGNAAKLFIFPKSRFVWFSIRHGGPMERCGVLEGSLPASVVFRPQKFDTVVYDQETGDLRINANTISEKRLYMQTIGKHIFKDMQAFQAGGKYTLEPLTDLGEECLKCDDVPGISKIKLTSITCQKPGSPPGSTITASSDVFAHLRSNGREIRDAGSIIKASFEVKFDGCKKTRRVTVTTPSKVDCTREDDADTFETWLQNRGFINNNFRRILSNERTSRKQNQAGKTLGRDGQTGQLFNF